MKLYISVSISVSISMQEFSGITPLLCIECKLKFAAGLLCDQIMVNGNKKPYVQIMLCLKCALVMNRVRPDFWHAQQEFVRWKHVGRMEPGLTAGLLKQ